MEREGGDLSATGRNSATLISDGGQVSVRHTVTRRVSPDTPAPSSISGCHLLVSVALGGKKGNQPHLITNEGVALVGLTDKPSEDGTRLFPPWLCLWRAAHGLEISGRRVCVLSPVSTGQEG